MKKKSKNKNTSFKWFENAKIYQVLIDRYAGYKEKYNIEN